MLRARPGPRPCWRLERNDWIDDPFARSKFVVHDGSPAEQSCPGHQFGRPNTVGKSLWTPARLSPLLAVNRGWDEAAQRDSAFRLSHRGEYLSFCGEGVRLNCSTSIISTPGSWENVLVTDPPCFEACVALRLVVGHYGIPDGTMQLSRTVKNPHGLRCEDLIFGALKVPGWVSWSLHGRMYTRQYKRPDKILKRLEERLGVRAVLESGICHSRISLHGMAVPTEEEWSTVK